MKRDTNPTTISRFFQAKRARPQTDERPGKSSKAAAAPKLQRQTAERDEPAPVRTLRTLRAGTGREPFYENASIRTHRRNAPLTRACTGDTCGD